MVLVLPHKVGETNLLPRKLGQPDDGMSIISPKRSTSVISPEGSTSVISHEGSTEEQERICLKLLRLGRILNPLRLGRILNPLRLGTISMDIRDLQV